MAWTTTPIARYTIQLRKDGWTVQVRDSASNNLAQFMVWFNGTMNNPVKIPPTGMWPTSAYVRIDIPEARLAALVDMLRNEGPVDLSVDPAASPIDWHLDTRGEPTGEGEL
jgi:hypothetical protein